MRAVNMATSLGGLLPLIPDSWACSWPGLHPNPGAKSQSPRGASKSLGGRRGKQGRRGGARACFSVDTARHTPQFSEL